MKKIFSLLCFLFLFMTFTNVSAADFSTYLSGNKSIGENGTVTVTVGVNKASNLWGFKAPINYDSSKLTLTKSTGLSGFGVAVGSSFVATMMGITEVNPLPAHYLCKNCHLSLFEDDEGVSLSINYSASGYDLPDKMCPNCNTWIQR